MLSLALKLLFFFEYLTSPNVKSILRHYINNTSIQIRHLNKLFCARKKKKIYYFHFFFWFIFILLKKLS